MSRVSNSSWISAITAIAAFSAGCGLDEDRDGYGENVTNTEQAVGLSRAESTDGIVGGEVIVKFAKYESRKQRIKVGSTLSVANRRLRAVAKLPSGAWLMRLDDMNKAVLANKALQQRATLSAVKTLGTDARVRYAQANYELEPSGHPSMPRDPLLNQQWHYTDINLRSAWRRTTGQPTTRIAVLDTGTVGHPDLVPGFAPGRDFTHFSDGAVDTDTTDESRWHHGTHVTGIVGARANNIGGVGVCPNCTIVPVRIASPSTNVAIIEQAIHWAATEGRADVITLSFNGGPACSQTPSLIDTLASLPDGVVVTVSAGNNDGQTEWPADCPGVIGVSASDRDGALAEYSSSGVDTDITAPGGGFGNSTFYGDAIGCPPDGIYYDGTEGVVSTWAISNPGSSLQPEDLCYRYLSGTSMAAPHVAGVAGLMLSVNPTLTADDVELLLKQTADPDGVTCPVAGSCGAGLLDAGAAVRAARPTSPTAGGWWNPLRSGAGMDLQRTSSGDYVAVWYTYRGDGTPIWYISDVAPLVGSLWRAPLFRSQWNYATESNVLTEVGSLEFLFDGNNDARLTWTLGGTSGTEQYTSFVFAGGAPVAAATGLWYPPSQSGWGMSLWQRANTRIMTVYAYDQSGRATWFQGVQSAAIPTTNFASLYQVTNGSHLCPGCSGSGSPITQTIGSGALRLPNPAGRTGQLTVDVNYPTIPGGWSRSVSISRLTAIP